MGLSLETSQHLARSPDDASEPASALTLVDPSAQEMPLRKWSNLYVKTHPERGVVFLLVERLHPDDLAGTEWTAVVGLLWGV